MPPNKDYRWYFIISNSKKGVVSSQASHWVGFFHAIKKEVSKWQMKN